MRDDDYFKIDDIDDYKSGYVDATFDDYKYTEEMLAEVDRMGTMSEEEARLDRLRLENERIEQAREERLRREREREENERREKERLERERIEREARERQRIEQERIEAERRERERLEAERTIRIKMEAERLERIRLEMAASQPANPVEFQTEETVQTATEELKSQPEENVQHEETTQAKVQETKDVSSEAQEDGSDDDYKIEIFASPKPDKPSKSNIFSRFKKKKDDAVHEDITADEIEKAVDDEQLRARLKMIGGAAIALVVVLIIASIVMKAILPGYDLGAGETIRLMNTDVTVPGDISEFDKMLENNNITMERLYYDDELNPGEAKSYYFGGDYYAAGFITVKNNSEKRSAVEDCDLVQINLEMLSSKTYANINFRFKGITPNSTKDDLIDKLGEPEAQKDKMFCYSATGTTLYFVLDSDDNISSFNIRKQ